MDATANQDVDQLVHGFHGPVRVADEIDRIAGYIQHYTALPQPDLAVLIGCWVVNTYTYQHFRYCGYLALRSATPQCGKTRLLRLIGSMSKGNRKPIAIPTAAVIFRCGWDVMLLDEVDKLRNSDKDIYGALLAVLNSGFERDAAVIRNERVGNSFEPKEFPVYGPKAFAGIEELADTLSDRTFQIQMERATRRQPRLVMRKMDDAFAWHRNSMELWASDTGQTLERVYDDLPDQHPDLESYDDRFQDVAEPLLVLATVADAERPAGPLIVPRLIRALGVAAGRRGPSDRERLLMMVLKTMASRLDGKTEVFVTSADLYVSCQYPDGGMAFTSPKALAAFLKLFDLSPRESPDGRCRGYWITQTWLDDKVERYGRREAVVMV